MKKNLYYRSLQKRTNIWKHIFLQTFSIFSTSSTMFLEVFTRKNFGERYFKLSSALTLAVVLAVLPFLIVYEPELKQAIFGGGYEVTREAPVAEVHLLPAYLTWYIFLGFFVYKSWQHKQDLKREPSVFDFAKFSLCRGTINPLFYKINIPRIAVDIRFIECYGEPAVFFAAGILLTLVGQKLGVLLIICSISYSIGYVLDYIHGDNFIMDKIDEIISNQNLEQAFVFDGDEEQTQGFRFRGRKPNSEEMRRKVLPLMSEDEEILVAK